MYLHLMVPVDESVLSASNVDTAVRLASQLGARITFFHATADFSATDEGALLRTIGPSNFDEAAIGQTNTVLSKAKVSANAAGVTCETMARTCDKPAEAIVELARERGCDLIVMASRGARGLTAWMHSSQTERVLRHSPIALLVTRVTSNDPLTPRERALAVILDEHRSIAVVVQGAQQWVQQVESSESQLDVNKLASILTYMQDFPLQQHHPKEERYLHHRLRQRAPDSEATLRELEAQHMREHALVSEAVRLQQKTQAGIPGAVEELRAVVQELVTAVWAHMRLEEDTILPLALKHFEDEDWTEIAEAFEANDAPSVGHLTATEFRRLFTRIANIFPTAQG